MNRHGLFLTLACSAQLWGGILQKDQQYRFCGTECTEAICSNQPGPACNKGKSKLKIIETAEKYKLAFVEYRDNGDPWDWAEVALAEQLIAESRSRGPIKLVFYVHGWKNNADERIAPNFGDVEKFRSYLEQYADAPIDVNRTPVIGIYIAWHGKSLNLPTFINWVSFWTRGIAARRVGSGKYMSQHIGRFVELAKRSSFTAAEIQAQSVDVQTPDAHARSRIVILSHSFGARVLESALVGPTSKMIPGTCKGLINGQSQRPPVDLVLFENAATGADYIWKQLNKCQPCGSKGNGCKDTNQDTTDFSKSVMVRSWKFDKPFCASNTDAGRCQPYPLMVSVSAKNDFLTRIVLFIAAGQRPAAFLPWLQTHRVKLDNSPKDLNRANGEVFQFEAEVNKNNRTYVVERKKKNHIAPVNAIWSMKVDKEVVNHHGGVWNPNLMNFQLNLVGAHDEERAQELKNYNPQTRRIEMPASANLRK